jgi:hypothetical protein
MVRPVFRDQRQLPFPRIAGSGPDLNGSRDPSGKDRQHAIEWHHEPAVVRQTGMLISMAVFIRLIVLVPGVPRIRTTSLMNENARRASH